MTSLAGPNIIDEVDTVGRSATQSMRGHVFVVLEHLMKLEASPSVDPSAGWQVTSLHTGRILDEGSDFMIADSTSSARKIAASVLAGCGGQPRIEVKSLTSLHAQVLKDWLPGTWTM